MTSLSYEIVGERPDSASMHLSARDVVPFLDPHFFSRSIHPKAINTIAASWFPLMHLRSKPKAKPVFLASSMTSQASERQMLETSSKYLADEKSKRYFGG
jgi:hypothetical protein